ncbi:single-stranded DNA-binding protein [Campylobacter sp. MG1]|uniref:single-stranded DNA-binding protein n=1 Tax=Campylobacter sp. MG1 TaxID=2976332 RepID=UPI00226CAAB5|nr:single-stranded DNA-binding protein [Campylobacter sp. MG1]
MNKVILIGRLTRDIEIKSIGSTGSAVVNNAMAVNRYRTSNSGEKLEETLFIDVVFFNRLAEIVNQYLRKGSKLMVEGFLQQQTWVDTVTNQNRSKIQLVVENMEMLDPKPSDDNMSRNNYQQNNNYNKTQYSNQNQQSSYQNIGKQNFNENKNNYIQDFDEISQEVPF